MTTLYENANETYCNHNEIFINRCISLCDKNKNFIDIGAKSGEYSINLASDCNLVYSFEPLEMKYNSLCESIELSKLKNIKCFQVELGTSCHCDNKSYSGAEGDSLHPEEQEKIKIETLDSFSLDNISFIKIDSENNEYDVLAGAKETLKNSNYPMIIFKLNNRMNDLGLLKTVNLLIQYGYNTIDVNGYSNMVLASVDHNKINNNKPVKYTHNLLLCSDKYPIKDFLSTEESLVSLQEECLVAGEGEFLVAGEGGDLTTGEGGDLATGEGECLVTGEGGDLDTTLQEGEGMCNSKHIYEKQIQMTTHELERKIMQSNAQVNQIQMMNELDMKNIHMQIIQYIQENQIQMIQDAQVNQMQMMDMGGFNQHIKYIQMIKGMQIGQFQLEEREKEETRKKEEEARKREEEETRKREEEDKQKEQARIKEMNAMRYLHEQNDSKEYFNVANRYFNEGNFEKSILFYERCMGGNMWSKDEIWASKLRLGHCYKNIGNIEKSIFILFDAYDYFPDRLEAIFEIIYYYRNIGKNKIAFELYKIGKKIFDEKYKGVINKYFASDKYLENKMDVEYTILAMHNGINNINDNVVNLLNNLHDNNYCVDLFSNMKFYKYILTPISVINLDEIVNLNINDSSINFKSSSGCMIKNPGGDGYLMNVRFVNYYITESGYYADCYNNILITANKFVELDKDLRVVDSRFFDVDYDGRKYIGIEDLRIFKQPTSNDIEFIGTCYQATEKIGISRGTYDFNNTKLAGYEIKSPMDSYCEKNWVYFDFNDEMHIVYKWFPLQIYKYNSDKSSIYLSAIRMMPRLFEHCRGSTCGFKYHEPSPGLSSNPNGNQEDKIETWFIVHIASEETPRHYYHVIAVFDNHMNLNRYSAPLTFEGNSIEYCLSLIVEGGSASDTSGDGRIIINYSTWDRTTRIGVYSKNYIESLLKYKI